MTDVECWPEWTESIRGGRAVRVGERGPVASEGGAGVDGVASDGVCRQEVVHVGVGRARSAQPGVARNRSRRRSVKGHAERHEQRLAGDVANASARNDRAAEPATGGGGFEAAMRGWPLTSAAGV